MLVSLQAFSVYEHNVLLLYRLYAVQQLSRGLRHVHSTFLWRSVLKTVIL